MKWQLAFIVEFQPNENYPHADFQSWRFCQQCGQTRQGMDSTLFSFFVGEAAVHDDIVHHPFSFN
jgi:hypothetical protein